VRLNELKYAPDSISPRRLVLLDRTVRLEEVTRPAPMLTVRLALGAAWSSCSRCNPGNCSDSERPATCSSAAIAGRAASVASSCSWTSSARPR